MRRSQLSKALIVLATVLASLLTPAVSLGSKGGDFLRGSSSGFDWPVFISILGPGLWIYRLPEGSLEITAKLCFGDGAQSTTVIV